MAADLLSLRRDIENLSTAERLRLAQELLERKRHRTMVAEAKDFLGDIAGNLRGGIVRYLDFGIQPGDFLCAVLDNNLGAAIARCSDPETLGPLVRYVHNYLPSEAWGSTQRRMAWQEAISALAHDHDPGDAPAVDRGDVDASVEEVARAL